VAEAEVTIPVVAPFDLHATVEALHRRPNALAEPFIDGEYRRVFWIDGEPALFGLRQVSGELLVARQLSKVASGGQLERAAGLLADAVGAAVELTAAQAHARRVRELAPLVDALAGMKPPRFVFLWEALLNVVPFQQVSLASGVAMLNRLVAALGPRVPYAGDVYYGLPSPTAVLGASGEQLRECGFSAAKVKTLRALAERIASGALSENQIVPLDDTQAIAYLTQLPGIGPWSAQVLLLRGFRRLGVFPQGDSGVARSLADLLGVSAAEAKLGINDVLATLAPYQGYLYFLLLGSRLLRQGILPVVAPSAEAPTQRSER
jgi:DNA-3-methyladenine glycosylase II